MLEFFLSASQPLFSRFDFSPFLSQLVFSHREIQQPLLDRAIVLGSLFFQLLAIEPQRSRLCVELADPRVESLLAASQIVELRPHLGDNFSRLNKQLFFKLVEFFIARRSNTARFVVRCGRSRAADCRASRVMRATRAKARPQTLVARRGRRRIWRIKCPAHSGNPFPPGEATEIGLV